MLVKGEPRCGGVCSDGLHLGDEDKSNKLLGDGVRSGEFEGGVFLGEPKGDDGEPTENNGFVLAVGFVRFPGLKQ